MTTFNVASTTALNNALASAKAGDIVLMAPGSYTGALNNLKYTGYVTIRSADPDKPAVFGTLDVHNSSYLRIEKVKVTSGSNGTTGSKVVDISEGSHHIEFTNSEVHGKVDADYTGHYGIYVSGASNILLKGNYVHDVLTGMANFGVTNLKTIGNRVNYIGEDSFKFSGIKTGLIQDNTGAGNVYPQKGAHIDFMQFQGSSRDLIIDGNVYLAKTATNAQGIFLNNGVYDNVTIANNVVYTGSVNAVYVSDGSNINVKYNTLLTTPDELHPTSAIRLLSGGSRSNNITSGPDAKVSGSNVTLTYETKSSPYYYNKVYVDAMEGRGLTMEDLRPIAGSVGATKGAYARILELLDGVSAPDSGPTTAPDSGSTTSLTPVFSRLGDMEFTGKTSDVVNIAHQSALAIDKGAIAFSFEADRIDLRQGLVSKDATGDSGGGNHFSAFIEGGKLRVLFKDEDSGFVLEKGVKANTEYDVLATFDEKAVKLWVDGTLVGTKSLDMDWSENKQWLNIGALGWGSASGASTVSNPYDGTISDVMVFNQAGTPDSLGLL